MKQIEKINKKLKKYKVSYVYSCDTSRCLKVAKGISESEGITNITDERLRSRAWGIFDGKTRGEIAQLCPESGYSIDGKTIDPGKKYNFKPPHGETWFEVTRRVEEFLRDLLNNYHDGNTVVIISHSGVSRIIISYLCSLDKFTLIAKPIPNVKFNIFNIKKQKNNKFLIFNFRFLPRYKKTFFNILKI